MKKECNNCEYNFKGICAGNGDLYKNGEPIIDGTKCCSGWGANIDFFCEEKRTAPRFLREAFNDCSLFYDDFSKQCDAYFSGEHIPINIFDAVKFIYGLSMVDIAVLMDVSFGVVYRAKVQGITEKRINQFSKALCIPTDILLVGTTEIFPALREGKKKLFTQSNIKEKLDSMPKWKSYLSAEISSEYLGCPLELAKTFARIDKFYWTTDLETDDFTESEILLINYIAKCNPYRKVLTSLEYSLDRACKPHIHMSFAPQKE